MIKLIDEYKILIIIMLAITLIAAFDQMEGTYFPKRYSLSRIEMTKPEFLSVMTKYLAFSSLLWVIYLQANKFKKQLLVSAVLGSVFFIDFLLESNICWGHIFGLTFGYRSVAFIIFGIVIIGTIIKEKWSSA